MDLNRRLDSFGRIIPDYRPCRYYIKSEYLSDRVNVILELKFATEIFEDNIKMALRFIAGQINERYNNKCYIEIKWLEYRNTLALDLGKRIVITEDYAKQVFRYNCFRSRNDVEKQGQSENTEHLKVTCWFRLIKRCRHG